MKKKAFEEKIQKAFENTTPEVFDEVVNAIDDEAAGNIIQFEAYPRKKKSVAGRIISLAAAFAVVIGIGAGSYSYLTPKATVEIDVNPSIEMKINSREHVVSCTANNDDAKKIVAGMDLRGTDIDVAVNALIGSMLRTGYLSTNKNSVLVSVTDKALEAKLADEISGLLDASIGTSAVMSQTIASSGSEGTLAAEYSISQGKAALINELVSADPTLEFSELAQLSVNDLNLLSATRHSEKSNITTKGEASSQNYIGFDAATQKALAKYPGAIVDETEFDCLRGVMVYEIELKMNGVEYEVTVDAVTGEILSNSEDNSGNHGTDSEPHTNEHAYGKNAEDKAEDADDRIEDAAVSRAFGKATVSQGEAVNIALGNLRLKHSDVAGLSVEKDTSLLKPVYNVEFTYDSYEYEFEIDAQNGKILKSEKSSADD